MPTVKIFFEGELSRPLPQLADGVGAALVEGLPAPGKIPAVVFVPASHASAGHVYVEVNARHNPDRTPQRMQALAETLHAIIDSARPLESRGRFRVRVILLENDHVFGFD